MLYNFWWQKEKRRERREEKKKEKEKQDSLWHNRFPDEVQNDYTPNRTSEGRHRKKNQLPLNYISESSFESGLQTADLGQREELL